MRCFAKMVIVSLCLLLSLLGVPPANAADGGHTASAASAPSSRTQSASVPEAAVERYDNLPLSFEANLGQADGQTQTNGQIRFLSRGSGYSFFLTQTGALLSFARDSHSEAVLRMQLVGASANAHIQGQNELPGKSNYFIGSDSSRWRTGIPTYSQVKYESVYPGINLIYYGNQHQLEYDFVVAPGADPDQIRLSVAGVEKLTVDAQGNLVLQHAAGEVQLLAPRIYQQLDGEKKEITGQWTLAADHVAGFHLGPYDRTQPLVIDPVLQYSSFLGGSQKNILNRIAIDAAGNAYVAGYTASGDFPAAPTPQAMTFGAGTTARGAFVAKIDPTGTNLLYSTYLSGSTDEEATGLAVDNSGNVYLAGNTHSTDFPTRNALQSTCPTHNQAETCASAFLTKISASGDSLLFSTYLGGSGGESARGVAIDSAGSAYVIGITSSLDFPVTPGAAQIKCGGACQQNAFVAKFVPSGESLAFATYIGGSAIDDAADLAVDSSGSIYLAGKTTSPDFPLAAPYQKSCSSDATNSAACIATAFVTKIKADGSTFSYSTYLGGSLGSQASAVAVDAAGSTYVTGSTQSPDFPVVEAFQKSCGLDPASGKCSTDAFLTKFTPAGDALVYSTYVGGTGDDHASAIAVDAAGNAHLAGTTESVDFPTLASVQSQLKGASDAFVARFSAVGSALTFSTYHGGGATESGNSIALDAKGNVYLAGETTSSDFPTYHPFQSSCAGACTSAFVSKMSLPPPSTVPPTIQKSFAPTSVELNVPASTSVLTLTIANPSANAVALTGVGVSDTIPSAMSASGSVTNTCGGTAALAAGPPQVLSLTGGALAIAGSCTVSVTVTGTTAGAIVNTTGNVTSTEGGTGTNANATLNVVAPPSLTKAFGAASIPVNSTTTLSFTVTNPAANKVALTGVAFTDTLPTGLTVATSSAASVCGTGTLTTTAATGVITLTGGTVAAGTGGNPGTCALPSITVTGATAGDYTNTVSGAGAITSTNGGTGAASNTADLSVGTPASILKTFTPATVALNGTSTLKFGIQNANPTLKLTGLAFTDNLPAGLVVASTPALTNTCGGTATATAGATSVSLTGGTLNATSGCDVSVSVTATTAGIKNNSVTISSTEGGTGNTSMASLTVAGPPAITKAFSNSVELNVASSTATMTLTITNSNTTPLTGVAVSDTLPAGMALATPTGIATTCPAGTATATGGVVALSGATLAASSSCTVTANVIGTTAGSIANTTDKVTSTNGGTGLAAIGNLVVVAPPILAEAFNPASTPLGSTTALTFTISNPSGNTVAETGVAFTDKLPTGLTVATSSTSSVCGTGTLSTTAATGVITFTGGTVAAAGTCSVPVTVTGAAAGSYSNLVDGTNGTVLISSTNGGTGVKPTQAATLTVAAPASITKAFAPTTITLGASSTLSFTLTNPATNTVALTGVAFSDPLPTGLVVSTSPTVTNTCGGTFPGSSSVSLSGGTIPVGTGGNPGTCTLSVTVTGTAGGLNIPNTTGAISSTAGGTGSASNTATITVQDYSITASQTAVTALIQGGAAQAVGTVTVAQNPVYTGTVAPATPACTPAGFACAFTNLSSPYGSTPVTAGAAAGTAVGLYSTLVIDATDGSTPAIRHNTSAGPLKVAVECTYSLGNSGIAATLPTYSPQLPNLATSIGTLTFFVTEIQGGTACPWSAQGTANVTLTTATSGQVSAPGTGSPVSLDVSAISALALNPQADQVAVSYFQYNGTTNTGDSVLNVVQELPVPQTVVAGGATSFSLLVGATSPNNQNNYTLSFPTISSGTVCNALDPSGNPTTITCAVTSAPPAGATPVTVPMAAGSPVNFTLWVSVPAGLKAANREPGRAALVYALLTFFPAIVLTGTGFFAFGSTRKRNLLKRLTSAAGLLLLLSFLVLLPSCGGGFKATLTTPTQTSSTYSLIVMGYATDGSNNVQGLEIFTVPLTVTTP
jgi:uncharacterized repeat protein (TIGR01451 family)